MPKTRPIQKTLKDNGLSGKLVLIEWIDCHSFNGWRRDDPSEEDTTCISVGFLTHDGEKVKTVSPHMTTYEENCQRNGDMTIPIGNIVHMKTLNV